MINHENHQHHHHDHHHNLPPFHQRKFWKFPKNYICNQKYIAYVIALALTYALGYFTALPSTSTHQTIFTSSSASVDVTTNNNCPPIASPTVLEVNNDHNRFGPKCADPVPSNLIRSTILARVFNGTSPYENFPPAHIAHLLKPMRVKGWGSHGPVFKHLITKIRPKTIIEVGTFLGASATHMAELTRQLGLQTQILCLDDFRGWAGFRAKIDYVPAQNGDVLLYAQFLQNVLYLNSTESILPVPYSTGSTLQKFCEWGLMADLIEIDAGHDFHSAWADINWAYKLVRPGGVIFGHDYFTKFDNKGVKRAVDLFAKVHGLKVQADGEHWVIEYS